MTTSNEVAVIGQPVTFTATVSPVSSTATPTGAVVFLADNNPIGVGVLNSSDQATFTTSSLGYGFHTITATYVGDSVFQSSTSSAIRQFITSVGTQPTLTVLPVRNRQGKIVKLDIEAQIGVTAPGTGTPLGNTTFFVNGRARTRRSPRPTASRSSHSPVRRLINRYVFARYLGYFTCSAQCLHEHPDQPEDLGSPYRNPDPCRILSWSPGSQPGRNGTPRWNPREPRPPASPLRMRCRGKPARQIPPRGLN